MLSNLFSPLKIGKMVLENRLVVPAMSTSYCNPDGSITDRFIAYHEARAKGGWGLIVTEYTPVDKLGHSSPGQPCLWDDSLVPGHKKLTDAVHKHGGKIVTQLYHCGRQTAPYLIDGNQPVSSSAVPCPLYQVIPRELTVEEIKGLLVKFADAAERAKNAGYDGVEIHGAHGYLVAQFMSLYANKRTDEYGGSFINRMRFPMEIIKAVKDRCGKDFPLIFRISVDEFVPGGNTIEDTKTIVAMMEESGADAIHISCAVVASAHLVTPPGAVAHGWLTDYSEEFRKVVNIPVIAVNRVTDPIMADTIIKSGKADAISMGRGSLADPELPNKAKEGKYNDITYCIGCLQSCMGNYAKGLITGCTVNPATGKEIECAVNPAANKHKVFIAGGGPAGMEAAIVAARRGHSVELFEKDGKLGGQFSLAGIPTYKGEFNAFTVWQKGQLSKLNVKIHLNTELTAELVAKEKPDTVVVATGARPNIPDIGRDSKITVTANDALAGKVFVGTNAVIVGGGMVGAETASFLANHGKQVTIVEMLTDIARDEEPLVKMHLMEDLTKHQVRFYTSSKVVAFTDEGIDILVNDQEKISLAADTVVVAVGSRPVNDLSAQLQGKVGNLITIGDAANVRKAVEAIQEGYQAGLDA